jgi:N-acetylglucosamine kinase-like BadF-type ATPase
MRTESTDVVLAIDGGNSKTDAAVVTLAGDVLARVRGDGFRPSEGKDLALGGLRSVATTALERAGVGRAALMLAALANSDFDREDREYTARLQRHQLADRVVVRNDTLALLRSGTRSPAAVTVVCGAGMNCTGIAPDGSVVRFLALGDITGDWGGGGGLAREVMFWAMRDEDGRSGRTALTAAVAQHFGVDRVAAVAEALHFGELEESRLHELVPVLFTVAATGDGVARKLIRRQADEVVAFAMAALRRLGLLGTPTEVVLGGGVLAAGHPLLLDPIRTALAAGAPQAVVSLPQVRPILGSVLLGWAELVGAPVPEAVEQRIRAQLR